MIEFCPAINCYKVFHNEKFPEIIEGKFSITILFLYVNNY